LLEFYEKNPDFIAPATRRNEVISFVKSGLADLSVSRTTFKWGVPVPGDPQHIMYVWLDALTNYITAAGYPDTASDGYRKFWPADLHMVGKDIVRFHAIYWPAFLMGAKLPPPKRVFAHGWWTNEGQKISKSLGNVIDPLELIKQYGLDQVRYFLLREVPFGNDGDFSRQAMINRMNNDLADKFGNLAQRILKMVQKNCDAKLPAPAAFTAEDQALLAAADGLLAQIRSEIHQQAFHKALDAIWQVVGEGNRYVDTQAPWTLRKSGDLARMNTVLYVVAELVRQLAILCQPFMPGSCGRMLDQLAVPPGERTFAALTKGHALKPGTALPDPAGIFPKYAETAPVAG
jgi:methionyl-tRNA synthetase